MNDENRHPAGDVADPREEKRVTVEETSKPAEPATETTVFEKTTVETPVNDEQRGDHDDS